ncbi:MAG: DNA polymerase III subunit delta [Patescibacteria group bacterium]
MFYLIHGPDIFRAQQYIEELILTHQKVGDISVKKIDGQTTDNNQLTTFLEPLQLFSNQQILVIKNILSNKKNKTLPELILKYLENPDPNNTIILWEQAPIDQRTSFYKKIVKISKKIKNNSPKSHPIDSLEIGNLMSAAVRSREGKIGNWKLEILSFPLLKQSELITWLSQYCKEKKINITPDALRQLIFKNPDTGFLHQEVKKLATFSHNQITIESVNSLTPASNQEIIFNLTDQLGSKQKNQAHRAALNLLKKGEQPQMIIAALFSHFSNLINIKQLIDKKNSNTDIKNKTKLHPFVIEKCLRQCQNFSLADLKKIIGLIAQADINLKSGQSDFESEIFKIIFFEYENV